MQLLEISRFQFDFHHDYDRDLLNFNLIFRFNFQFDFHRAALHPPAPRPDIFWIQYPLAKTNTYRQHLGDEVADKPLRTIRKK